MASRKTKVLIGALAGVAVLGGLVAVATAKPRRSGEEEEGIDLDALPPEPSPSGVVVPSGWEEQSPGWPQPAPSGSGEVVLPPLVVTSGPPAPMPTMPPVTIPQPVVVPTTVAPAPTLPLPVVVPQVISPGEQGPDALTVQLVDELREAERRTGWKRTYQIVRDWQAAHGRVVDGKFGPKDGIYLASLIGDVPVVRYWPAADGRNPRAAVEGYRDGLLTIASAKGGAHGEMLRQSAAIEKGQSFGPPQGDGGKAPVLS